MDKIDKFDIMDDKLFEVLVFLNKELGIGLDIENANHTELIINSREALKEELEKEKQND